MSLGRDHIEETTMTKLFSSLAACSLALCVTVGGAQAQTSTGTDAMKKDSMHSDAMKSDPMKTDAMAMGKTKKDCMHKASMEKDSMKKADMMKHCDAMK
jgi:pentapeptide MXKDX repeat protein